MIYVSKHIVGKLNTTFCCKVEVRGQLIPHINHMLKAVLQHWEIIGK